MKNILIVLLVILGGNLMAQDAITRYFDKYVDDERFTVIYISPKMFQLFDKLDLELEDYEARAVMDVVTDLRGLRILIAEDSTANFYGEAMKKINPTEYETLMTVRRAENTDVNFLIKDSGDTISELLLMVNGDGNFVMMSFIGNISLDKISKMAMAFEKQ